MLLNCGVAEDSWESLGLQVDQTINPKGNQSSLRVGQDRVPAKSCPTTFNPMNRSTPDFPVYYLLKSAQTHVHWVCDTIHRSHPLFSSVQLLSHVQLLRPHGLQLPCPSPTPRACSNSCPLSLWYHSTILSFVIPSPDFNLSQHQGLLQWVNSSHQVAKVLEFQLQHQSFQWTPRTDLL